MIVYLEIKTFIRAGLRSSPFVALKLLTVKGTIGKEGGYPESR